MINSKDYIIIKKARENNLKNIDINIPKNKLVIITGVSGSGKSTLAFDTIYAEGQRRYVESLSSYARQFLGGISKADVDSIEGLSPSIAIDQKTISHNPRSTVGTMTEIYDYLRLLFARIGKGFCPLHEIEIKSQTPKDIFKNISSLEEDKILLLSPIVKNQKGSHETLINDLIKDGFLKVRLNGELFFLEDVVIDGKKKNNVDLVIDEVTNNIENKSRIMESIELGLNKGKGDLIVFHKNNDILFSSNLACPICGYSLPKLEPNFFSFNSPLGACKSCKGLGVTLSVDVDKLVIEPNKSIKQGALRYYKGMIENESIEWKELELLSSLYNIDLNKPFNNLTNNEINILLKGSPNIHNYTITTKSGNKMNRHGFIEGVATRIERLYEETSSPMMREYYASFLEEKTCLSCMGKRLHDDALNVRVGGLNIFEVSDLPIKKIYEFFNNLKLNPTDTKIADLVLKEIQSRLTFLLDVGLNYLTLTRISPTLSGGEAQRIRLATQIGSRLTGVLYVLDEPSIGLHQKDNERLINSLIKMRDLGNSLLVVEHDEETMLKSDYIIDIGPGAGKHGGRVIAEGSVDEIIKNPESITGQYLSGKKKILTPKKRNTKDEGFITIIGARENNLKNITVDIPLNKLVLVTGVSGSGKSSLINRILYPSINKYLDRKSNNRPGNHDKIIGIEQIKKIVSVSQEPIGRTPRSNPATYVGVFDDIRDLFANTNESKARGYLKGRFSFNLNGGRCERCQGDGVIRVPMNFLPSVYVTCEECEGKRYNDETLEIKYKNKNIYQILEMTVEESLTFFENIPNIKKKLQTLFDVGLGYIKLGQSALTLSGGEAQRIKLSKELQKNTGGNTLYILDEPTIGLHSDDVNRLIKVINKLVSNKNSIIIIEHNLDIIKQADYIIDLGPDGGDQGGMIVGKGTPEELSMNEKSYTGMYLKKIFEKEKNE